MSRRCPPGLAGLGWIARALSFAALAAAGCSAIVSDAPSGSVACRVIAGDDPCRELGEGWVCSSQDDEVEGVCREGSCGLEACGNGVDDDCDGEVDEGNDEICNGVDDDCDTMVDEGLDADGDGYTWCPTGPRPVDCDDTDGSVRPTRPGDTAQREVCDGLDNDCDPSTPDGSDECTADNQDCDSRARQCVELNCRTRESLCTEDQFCDTNSEPPRCLPKDMRCFDPAFACEGAQVCDPTRGECVTPQPNGAFCTSDAQCESRLCFEIGTLRLTRDDVGADASGVCGVTCCSDFDCGAGERCWDGGGGTRACVDEALLTADHPPPATSPCAGPICEQECVLGVDDAFRLTDRVSLSCGEPLVPPQQCGTFELFCGENGICMDDGRCHIEDCENGSDCPSGICAGGLCLTSCRTHHDCPTTAAFGDALRYPSCTYIGFTTSGNRTDVVPVCLYLSSEQGADGAECSEDSGCRDRACVDARGENEGARRCADTCCSDGQCGGGEQCRPVFIRGRWETHCLPRPVFGPVADAPG